MKLTLNSVRPEVGNVKTFIWQPESPLQWQAGQYMHYQLPHNSADDRGLERWFTISSAPHEDVVQITTRIFEDEPSTFKQSLNSLSVGQSIEADGPEGSFTITDPNLSYVFIAGGIGITPMRSMLSELHAANQPINVTLLYANRLPDEIVFNDELEFWASQHENLTIEYFIGDNKIDQSTLERFKSGDFQFYVSGPEPMVKAMNEQLQAVGIAEDKIKLDDFPGYETI